MAIFSASIPNPQFRQTADSCSRYLQQDSSGNLYAVQQGQWGAGADPGRLRLNIWKSTDGGVTWIRIVSDVDRETSRGMDVCMIADVLHMAIVNTSVAPNSNLGMYRYDTVGGVFLADDYGGPADSSNSVFVSIVPMSNGSVNICYKSNDPGAGAYNNAKVTNWLAGVWGAAVNFVNEATANFLPQWAIKEATTERVHYFFGDNGTNIDAEESIWHASIAADGVMVGTLQRIAVADPVGTARPRVQTNAWMDIGNPSILGADTQMELPYVVGADSTFPATNESLRVLRAVPAENPVWSDELVVAAGSIAPPGNIEPYLGFGWFDCGSVVQGSEIVLLFTFTKNVLVNADCRGWLYKTSTTAVVGGWSVPDLLFTPTPITQVLASPYPLALADGSYGVVLGGIDVPTSPAYASLGLWFIGFGGLSIVCNNPPVGIVQTEYVHEFPVDGGTPPYSFLVTVGVLPLGLILDPDTGIVSGNPLANGIFPFTIQVTDSEDNTSDIPCSITIRKRCLLVEVA